MSCCTPSFKSVGPGQTAINFFMSVKNAVGHALRTGKIKADDETIKKRVDTCFNCEYLQNKSRCKACGCFVVAKAGLDAEKCPKGYW